MKETSSRERKERRGKDNAESTERRGKGKEGEERKESSKIELITL